MKLTVFAATGRIGALVVARALADGHDVTAVARKKITSPVRSVVADLTAPDPEALADAVAGSDAVISGLGPRTKADAGATAAPGTRAIVAAMRAAGVTRLAVVSAAPLTPVASPDRPNPPRRDPGDGFVMRHLGGRSPGGCSGRTTTTSPRWRTWCVRAASTGRRYARPGRPTARNRELPGRYGRSVRGGWSRSPAPTSPTTYCAA